MGGSGLLSMGRPLKWNKRKKTNWQIIACKCQWETLPNGPPPLWIPVVPSPSRHTGSHTPLSRGIFSISQIGTQSVESPQNLMSRQSDCSALNQPFKNCWLQNQTMCLQWIERFGRCSLCLLISSLEPRNRAFQMLCEAFLFKKLENHWCIYGSLT